MNLGFCRIGAYCRSWEAIISEFSAGGNTRVLKFIKLRAKPIRYAGQSKSVTCVTSPPCISTLTQHKTRTLDPSIKQAQLDSPTLCDNLLDNYRAGKLRSSERAVIHAQLKTAQRIAAQFDDYGYNRGLSGRMSAAAPDGTQPHQTKPHEGE